MATVYAVASAKGGVGKTTTAAAMATILSGSGADVVAIDADIGMANLAGALGVTPGETTLHDVLAGRAEPLDAVREGPEGLRVVPGATDLDAYASADPAGLADVVEAFADADYVLVDAGAGLSHDSSLPLAIADETLLVSTAERSALGDTEKTRQLAERLGGTVAGAAVTRVDPDADPDGTGAGGPDDPTEVLEATVLGRIPEDDAVVRAATANSPLPTYAPDAPATRAYRDLTRALTGAAVEGDGIGDAGGDEEHVGGDDEEDADEEHVGGDDLEAMVEADEAEAFDGPESEDDAESESDAEPGDSEVDGAESIDPDAAGDEPDQDEEGDAEPAADDELAGSVPFRDDDTGTMNTVLAEGDEAAASDEAASTDEETTSDEETADGDESESGDAKTEESERGGFFSRLLGR